MNTEKRHASASGRWLSRTLSDAELMAWDGTAFAHRLIEKAKAFGTYMLHRDHYEMEEFEPAEYEQRQAEWCSNHAWAEWWLGVIPPCRQIVALPDADIGLKVRLSQQIVDEVKHQRILSKHARRFHGDTRFERLTPPPALLKKFQSTAYEDPLDIASSLQLTGEVILLGVMDESSAYQVLLEQELRSEYDIEIQPEEVRHVNNGRDIIAKFADTAAKRRRACEVQDIKLRAWIGSLTADLRASAPTAAWLIRRFDSRQRNGAAIRRRRLRWAFTSCLTDP